MIITAAWAFVLLGRATEPYSTLRWPVLIIGVLAAVGLLLAHRLPKALAGVVLGLALLGAGTGPAAYAVQTAATPHQGSIVTAGPVSGNSGPGGQGGPGRARIGAGAAGGGTFRGGQPQQGSQAPQGGAQGGQPGGDRAGVSTELAALLVSDASSYRWAAATTGSQSAAGYQLATGLPVMAIGGFNGGDPSPTLEQFQAYVAQGEIHFYLSGGEPWRPRRRIRFCLADRDLGQRELHRRHRRKRRGLRPHLRPLSRSMTDLARKRAPEMITAIDPPAADAHDQLPRGTSTEVDPVVDIVVPVHNEEVDLAPSVRRLDSFLATTFPYSYCITIADNASTDGTWSVAQGLAAELPQVQASAP